MRNAGIEKLWNTSCEIMVSWIGWPVGTCSALISCWPPGCSAFHIHCLPTM